MKLRTAAVDLTDDAGRRIAGPYMLDYSTGKAALPEQARRDINDLKAEFGPLELNTKEQPK
jgi:hypothetical protein